MSKARAKAAEALMLLREAEELAEQEGEGFSFHPAYGMGGHYVTAKEADSDDYHNEAGWQSSSSSC